MPLIIKILEFTIVMTNMELIMELIMDLILFLADLKSMHRESESLAASKPPNCVSTPNPPFLPPPPSCSLARSLSHAQVSIYLSLLCESPSLYLFLYPCLSLTLSLSPCLSLSLSPFSSSHIHSLACAVRVSSQAASARAERC